VLGQAGGDEVLPGRVVLDQQDAQAPGGGVEGRQERSAFRVRARCYRTGPGPAASAAPEIP
jgi:hypothetical protein